MRFLYQYRGRPGANWFLLVLVSQAVFCLSYGSSLFVFDPELRLAFEALTWIGLVGTGPLFLAFALEYTGRGDLVRSWLFAPIGAVFPITVLLVVLLPYHDLLLSDFRLHPVFGAATVQYTFGPWGYVVAGVGIGAAGLGVLLLLETILSYGPLYRREATAVALSTVPPTVGLVLWLFELGPVPHVNFAPILFIPHVILDGYAFVGTNMFESNPTTRRAADRTAIDDLDTPVVVLDTNERVVNLNRAAQNLFDVERQTALGTAFELLVDADVEDIDERTLTLRTAGQRREFTLSSLPLTDPRGTVVGETVVFQDVTRERRREQRLGVLNRVLRHNLRNEMTVIQGYARTIQESPDDPRVEEWASIIDESSGELLALGEKAREFEQLMGTDGAPETIDLDEVLKNVRAALERAATIDIETAFDEQPPLRGDPALLELGLRNLLEATLEYNDAPDPVATVHASTGEDHAVVITIQDDGPGIPESELAPLREGTESALQHGSGIGLWIAKWSITALGGALTFQREDVRTTVTVSLPQRSGFDRAS
jgi:signal transduction histidine kinase